MAYALLVILWIAWCTLHSVLIGFSFTEWLQQRFPGGFRYYRLIFNTVSLVTLLPVLLYMASLRGAAIVAWEGPWKIIPALLGGTALFFFAAGALRYDLFQFLGLRQIKDEKACSALTDDCSLETGGILSVVRHPWYTGGLLIVWARPLDPAAILTNLVVSAYFLVGALMEERKLIIQFGQVYRDYQRQVSMLLPFKWLGKRFMSGKP